MIDINIYAFMEIIFFFWKYFLADYSRNIFFNNIKEFPFLLIMLRQQNFLWYFHYITCGWNWDNWCYKYKKDFYFMKAYKNDFILKYIK